MPISPKPSPAWWRPALNLLLPGTVLVVFMAYYWRIINPAARVPAYGDSVEYLWAIDWFVQALRTGVPLLFVPHVFMPEGWSLATFANGIGVFVLALPVAWLTSAAVAYNVLEVAAFFVAYFGMYRLGRLVVGRWPAILAALLYLLWGGRWVRAVGHLHILMGSALLPLLVYFLDRSLSAGQQRRQWLWLAAAAALWALAISFSLYFIWIGLFLVVAWLLGAALGRRITFGRAVLRLAAAGALAVLFCSPYLYLYWRGQSGAVGYDVGHLDGWSLSLNWLPALYPYHPLPEMAALAQRQVNGVFNESSVAGFGIVLALLAVGGLAARRHRRAQWSSLAAATLIGVLLALGPTLHWADRHVSVPGLEPINEVVWRAGHALKPDIFPGTTPPAELAQAVPLPGLLLTALLPYFEGARVPSRYLLVAAPGVLLLAALAIERLPKRWLKLLVAGLMLVEAARSPITGVPFPPPTPPAFDALAALPVGPGESLLDLTAPAPNVLFPGVGGETLWATNLHGQPIAGGGGSILPAHTAYLRDWFFAQPDPAGAAEFPWLLRGYGIRYLLLHMPPQPADTVRRLAAGTADLLPLGCYEGATGPPWDHPMCLLEVTPAPNPAITVYPAANWSGAEPWGVWALGHESRLRWVATNREAARFAVEAFPYCIEGVPQELMILVDGQMLAAHRWDDCEPWKAEFSVPADMIEVGWNEISLRFGRADRPADVTGGENPDIRELSVGFTRFERLP
ncbi:MAG: hypothetical protein KA170_00590 [Candidatus Promineofilum sp.]|nr:hypothetical protein [Promineifilum sp.]